MTRGQLEHLLNEEKKLMEGWSTLWKLAEDDSLEKSLYREKVLECGQRISKLEVKLLGYNIE